MDVFANKYNFFKCNIVLFYYNLYIVFFISVVFCFNLTYIFFSEILHLRVLEIGIGQPLVSGSGRKK